MIALSVEQLRKTFGETVAVDGISFTAAPGEIFGLLGPNGAGKSTTLNCVCGLLPPTGGRILVMDQDIVRSGAEGRELATARWGMPSSARALMDATKN